MILGGSGIGASKVASAGSWRTAPPAGPPRPGADPRRRAPGARGRSPASAGRPPPPPHTAPARRHTPSGPFSVRTVTQRTSNLPRPVASNTSEPLAKPTSLSRPRAEGQVFPEESSRSRSWVTPEGGNPVGGDRAVGLRRAGPFRTCVRSGRGDSLPHRGGARPPLRQMSQNVPDVPFLSFFGIGHRRPMPRKIPRPPSFRGIWAPIRGEATDAPISRKYPKMSQPPEFALGSVPRCARMSQPPRIRSRIRGRAPTPWRRGAVAAPRAPPVRSLPAARGRRGGIGGGGAPGDGGAGGCDETIFAQPAKPGVIDEKSSQNVCGKVLTFPTNRGRGLGVR